MELVQQYLRRAYSKEGGYCALLPELDGVRNSGGKMPNSAYPSDWAMSVLESGALFGLLMPVSVLGWRHRVGVPGGCDHVFGRDNSTKHSETVCSDSRYWQIAFRGGGGLCTIVLWPSATATEPRV